MSKAVLISIRPEWCEKIFSGEKTIEVRKTRPKLDPPFKCYVYCTKARYDHEDFIVANAGSEKAIAFYAGGKIIGEFACDRIEKVVVAFNGGSGPMKAVGGNEVWFGGMLEHLSCLSIQEICRYIGGIGGKGYGWHISDLKIYDEPKELSNFHTGKSVFTISTEGKLTYTGVKRAPQSWCYVEESTIPGG